MLPLSAAVDKKKNDPYMTFDPATTYTMSFHSCNLDLVQWKVVNVRGIKETDLAIILDRTPVRLVAYQVVDESASATAMGPAGTSPPDREKAKIKHTAENKKYFFSFEVKHTGGAVKWKQ